MKITKIRFENIHSLKGVHEIDFAEGILGEAGLFAITGPTGSGKSTLLDIITLGLYNRIARVDKAVSNSILEDDGGIMTRNMRSCYAEVEYRVNGKEYRSHWSIERNRNNNLNSRKQELVEIATNTIIESGTKTPEKNAAIIGLSYEQFVKAMVLAQGEFSKLLQASRNDRNKLLEDITGARSYREIGRTVYRRFAKIKEKVKLKEAGLETMEVLSPEAVEEKNNELKVLNLSKPETEKTFQVASEKIKIRKQLLEKLEANKLLEENKQILKGHFERFKGDSARLEQHEKLSKYSQELRQYDSILKEIENSHQLKNSLLIQKDEEKSLQKKILETSSALVGEKLTIENANEKLEFFRSKISALQTKENTKQNEASLYQSQLKAYCRNIVQLGYQFSVSNNVSEFKIELESLQNSIQETIKNSGLNSIEELNSKLQILRSSNETALQLLNKKEETLKTLNNLETQKENLKAGEEVITEDSKNIKSLQKEISSLEKQITEQNSVLEHQRKHQSLEQHRAQLKPNIPCPLCGSLEHPYAKHQPHFDVKEELLKDNQKLLKTKSDLEIGYRQKIKFQSDSNEKSKKEITLLSEEYSDQSHALQKLGNILSWNCEENLDILQNKRRLINQQIEQLEKSSTAFQAFPILVDLKKSSTLWEQALNEFKNFNKERTKLYSGNNIDQDTNTLTTKITRSLAQLASLKKQLQESQNKLKKSSLEQVIKKKSLDAVIEKEKLHDINQLKSLILDEETATTFRRKNTKLNEGAARLSETEKSLTEDLKKLRELDDNTIPMESLTDSFEQTKNKWNELSISIGKITESLEKDTQTKLRQKLFMEQLNSLKKDQTLWKTMNDLIGDANGNKFSNFVQDLTLEQLIGFANKRLMEFSDRYILDIPTAEEAEKSDTLKIFDKYMGNARRSVRTLSGGETFLVSLAMAFALSDIASRNVKIESLFIDEGFGTLDPETLDQAITILEKMQNEGDKSVGVISHVSALKERITTQIKLEKGSLGYSTIEIVQ